MAGKVQCRFFILRYAPDAVKNEFINVGLVLLPPAGGAQVRFTRDWSRVLCLDPEADVEMLQALENDLRNQLHEMNGDRDLILRRIQDSFSNAIQPSEFQACLAGSPVTEADELARLYLERPRRRQKTREPIRAMFGACEDQRVLHFPVREQMRKQRRFQMLRDGIDRLRDSDGRSR